MKRKEPWQVLFENFRPYPGSDKVTKPQAKKISAGLRQRAMNVWKYARENRDNLDAFTAVEWIWEQLCETIEPTHNELLEELGIVKRLRNELKTVKREKQNAIGELDKLKKGVRQVAKGELKIRDLIDADKPKKNDVPKNGSGTRLYVAVDESRQAIPELSSDLRSVHDAGC